MACTDCVPADDVHVHMLRPGVSWIHPHSVTQAVLAERTQIETVETARHTKQPLAPTHPGFRVVDTQPPASEGVDVGGPGLSGPVLERWGGGWSQEGGREGGHVRGWRGVRSRTQHIVRDESHRQQLCGC